MGGPSIGFSDSESRRIDEYFLLIISIFCNGFSSEMFLVIESEPKSSASYHDSRMVSFKSSETSPLICLELPLNLAVRSTIPFTIIGFFEALNSVSLDVFGL